tara:strand:+ start:192 stop:386 length:195 start_codon:yes stop_codon:yes gene_type:complete
MELTYRKMSFSMILILASNMQRKSEVRTYINKQPSAKFTLQPIAYLRKISDRIRRKSVAAEDAA